MLGLTAENIGTIILGVSIAIITLLGGQKGKQIAQGKPQTTADLVEVAGAIVSDKSVDRMVKSLDAFGAASTALAHAINQDIEAKTKLTAALNVACAEMKEVGDQLDSVKVEIVRAQARRS